MYCCMAMQWAIDDGYLVELFSYTINKVRFSLGVYIKVKDKTSLRIDLCPWCGEQLRNLQKPN